MTKVLISLQNEKVRKIVLEALGETRYEAVVVEPFDPAEGLEVIADKIMAQEAVVIIIDYWSTDAASVKLMQEVSDLDLRREFIFIECADDKAELEQIMMAINEGARAFLPCTFKVGALLSYVERAVLGPCRLRCRINWPQSNDKLITHLEEALGDLRIKGSYFQKLAAYLLATPVSAQNRKVLVVSDSPYQLELMKKILEEYNFVVFTASNPIDGLAIAINERPRIVVSGREFESQTGIEFCQAIKFTNKLVPCYFVICTSNEASVAKIMVPGNGVDDCIIKPSGQNDQIDFISRVAVGLLL